MLGLSAIGAMADTDPQRSATAMVQILTGEVDEALRHVIVFQRTGRQNATPEELRDEDVTHTLEQIKANTRQIVQRIFEAAAQEAAEEDRRERELNLEQVKAELRASNKPDPLGTVAELASKYNVSKSEIRRLKAAGESHTLVKDRT